MKITITKRDGLFWATYYDKLNIQLNGLSMCGKNEMESFVNLMSVIKVVKKKQNELSTISIIQS